MFTLREHSAVCAVSNCLRGRWQQCGAFLMLCCARLGMHMSVATPSGYGPRMFIMQQAIEFARHSGSRIKIINDPAFA